MAYASKGLETDIPQYGYTTEDIKTVVVADGYFDSSLVGSIIVVNDKYMLKVYLDTTVKTREL